MGTGPHKKREQFHKRAALRPTHNFTPYATLRLKRPPPPPFCFLAGQTLRADLEQVSEPWKHLYVNSQKHSR